MGRGRVRCVTGRGVSEFGPCTQVARSIVAAISMHDTRLHGVFKCACACTFVKDFTSKLCLLQVVGCALLFPRSMFCGRGKSRYCHTKADYFHGSGSCASCVGAQDFRDPSWGGVESLERRGISLLRRMRALDDYGGIASVFVRLVLRQSRVCCVHATTARLARQWASARPCQSRRVATHLVRFTGQCNAGSARFG